MSTNTAILIALIVIVVFCVLYYFWSKYRSSMLKTAAPCDNAEHGSKHHHHAECGAEVPCPAEATAEATDVSSMASSAAVEKVEAKSVKAASIKAAGKEHYGELEAPVY